MRERDQVRQLPDLVVYERDVGCVHGNVAADAAHCDADIRLLERGRIVHTVADHAHRPAAALGRVDVCQLVLRQARGVHVRDAEPSGDGLRRVRMVAGQQHRLHAQLRELRDHAGALCAQRVRERDEARKRTVHCKVCDRAALRALRLRFRRYGEHDAVFGQQLGVSGQYRVPIHRRAHAAPGHHLKCFGCGQRRAAALPVGGRDRLAERVLRELLG